MAGGRAARNRVSYTPPFVLKGRGPNTKCTAHEFLSRATEASQDAPHWLHGASSVSEAAGLEDIQVQSFPSGIPCRKMCISHK